jgi:hypothetical protein
MKKLTAITLFLVVLIILTSQTTPPQGGERRNFSPINQDSLAAERDKATKAVLESIKGKEKMPCDSVFKNITTMKGQTVERLMNIMNSWSKAIGTGCNGCHDPKDYASDKIEEKEMARAMVGMTQKINTDVLQKIKGLETEKIGCNTCHRGKKHP